MRIELGVRGSPLIPEESVNHGEPGEGGKGRKERENKNSYRWKLTPSSWNSPHFLCGVTETQRS
jgi:hypothetical protein